MSVRMGLMCSSCCAMVTRACHTYNQLSRLAKDICMFCWHSPQGLYLVAPTDPSRQQTRCSRMQQCLCTEKYGSYMHAGHALAFALQLIGHRMNKMDQSTSEPIITNINNLCGNVAFSNCAKRRGYEFAGAEAPTPTVTLPPNRATCTVVTCGTVGLPTCQL